MSKFHLKEKIFPFPNNLIIEWLEKKFLNAKEKALNSRFTYKKALDSLKKYPLAIKELSELKVIQNIGKGMIDKLEESWEELIKNYQEKIPITNTANEVSVESKVSTTENVQRTTLPKRRRSISLENISFSNNDDIFFSQNNLKNKAYIPRYRSGPYALLLTLLKSNEKVPNESVSKTDLIRKAQPLCDSSFTIPAPPGSFKTAWMGMSTLLKKELVIKVSTRPCRYMATNTGNELAQKLARAAKEMSEKSQSENTETVNNTSLINPLEQSTFILEDDYDILLLVDNNEYYGPMARKCTLIHMIETSGIKCDVRHLTIGDFIWVARSKNKPNDPSQEIVLDFIIERKRIDDLSHSIIDGRYKEQKFRLRRCGIKNVIYLIEGKNFKGNEVKEQTLFQSIVNTMISENFVIHRTKDTEETVAYLQNITDYLTQKYKNTKISAKSIDRLGNKLNVHHATFSSFNEYSTKSQDLKVKEMFTYTLMHIEGMSYKKTVAITNAYPTVASLIIGYDSLDTVEKRENMLNDLIIPGSKRKLGQVISKHIHKIYYA